MSTMTFLINDSSTGGNTPVVQITITENADGTVTFDVTQLVASGYYLGDLRGLFFDVANEDLVTGGNTLTATSTMAGLTEIRFGDDTVKDLGDGANMQGLLGGDGGYDVGIEIGTSGIGKDDIQAFSFTLDSSLRALTLADFSNVSFGARLTSVGQDTNGDGIIDTVRNGSAKIGEVTFTVISPRDERVDMYEDQVALEDQVAPPPPGTTNGNLLANDGAGTSDTLSITGWTDGATTIGAGATFVSSILAGASVTINADGTWSVNANAADSLAEGESVSQTFTYTVLQSNADGSSTQTATFTVTITGTNDAPIVAATDVTGEVTEQVTPVGNLTDTGTIDFTDVDLTDVHSVGAVTPSADALGTLTASVSTGTDDSTGLGGVVTWNYSVAASAVEYLAKDQTKVETFTFNVLDGQGGSVARTVSVTLTGTNDAPIVAATDVTGAVTEQVTPVGNLTDTGTIDFTDVDLTDVHSVGAVTPSADALGTLTASVSTGTDDSTGLGGVVTWNYSVAASAVEYLAKDQTKVETFTFNVLDGQGGSVARTVSVTLTGTNDAPIVAATDVTGAVTEQVTPVGNLTDTGTIDFTDVDLTDVHSVGAVTPSAGALGTLTASVTTQASDLDGAGGVVSWNYSVAASAVEYLAKDQTKVETFSFTLDDGHGGMVARTVEVTLTGTNDAPAIVTSATTASGIVMENTGNGSGSA
ncbi:VCBS domain-containing protein [Polaromonas sp. P1-6]|nr:VCBS domain-containing protein [Polaromonas sp. P1-6]